MSLLSSHSQQSDSLKLILERFVFNDCDDARIYKSWTRRKGASELCVAIRMPSHPSGECVYVYIASDDSVWRNIAH
jgi:hypothetical protein